MKYALVVFGLIVLSIVSYWLYGHQASFIGNDFPLSQTSYSGTGELVASLIANQEYFFGTVSMKYMNTDKDKVEVVIMNDQTGDDSTDADEYYIVMERKQDAWNVVQSKTRWKCKSHLLFAQWTTNPCI